MGPAQVHDKFGKKIIDYKSNNSYWIFAPKKKIVNKRNFLKKPTLSNNQIQFHTLPPIIGKDGGSVIPIKKMKLIENMMTKTNSNCY